MKLFWMVCCLALNLGLTISLVEDNVVNHEGTPYVNYNVEDSTSFDESRMRANELVSENRRNVRFLSESAEPLTTLFSKDETVRLETELVTDASISVVWFQVRQEDTGFRSYSGTEKSNSRYYVVLDDLGPGEYYWRVAVRTSEQYVFSPEYSFTIEGTMNGFLS